MTGSYHADVGYHAVRDTIGSGELPTKGDVGQQRHVLVPADGVADYQNARAERGTAARADSACCGFQRIRTMKPSAMAGIRCPHWPHGIRAPHGHAPPAMVRWLASHPASIAALLHLAAPVRRRAQANTTQAACNRACPRECALIGEALVNVPNRHPAQAARVQIEPA